MMNACMQAGSDDRPGDRRGYNIIAIENLKARRNACRLLILYGQFINMSLKPGEDKMSDVRNGISRFIMHAFTYVKEYSNHVGSQRRGPVRVHRLI